MPPTNTSLARRRAYKCRYLIKVSIALVSAYFAWQQQDKLDALFSKLEQTLARVEKRLSNWSDGPAPRQHCPLAKTCSHRRVYDACD